MYLLIIHTEIERACLQLHRFLPYCLHCNLRNLLELFQNVSNLIIYLFKLTKADFLLFADSKMSNCTAMLPKLKQQCMTVITLDTPTSPTDNGSKQHTEWSPV